jgi:hypothetical protein
MSAGEKLFFPWKTMANTMEKIIFPGKIHLFHGPSGYRGTAAVAKARSTANPKLPGLERGGPEV